MLQCTMIVVKQWGGEKTVATCIIKVLYSLQLALRERS